MPRQSLRGIALALLLLLLPTARRWSGHAIGGVAMVASSKGAIEGLTVALAAEWAPRIRVNAIAPSLTDTPLAATLLNTPEKRDANAQRHPLKRVGEPADLAATAGFLLSEDASWMTGQVLHADGGIGRLRV